MNKQPEALRLAEAMTYAFPGNLGIDKAAAELRRLAEVEKERDRLHEANQAMRSITTELLDWLDTCGITGEHLCKVRFAIAKGEQQ